MRKDVVDQLQILKSKDKFPIEDWGKRGLIPSTDEVRKKMNQEVNNFIVFIESKLKNVSVRLTEEVQQYLDEWDSFDFDTEETEYILDIMCGVLQMVDVDCNDIVI
jgi:hypothetical protein